jgi:S1-C subfamily serine protease
MFAPYLGRFAMMTLQTLLVSVSILVPIPKEPQPDHNGTGYLGVQLRETDTRVFIFKVLENSPAIKGGLKEMDQILKIDNEMVQSTLHASQLIRRTRPGNTMEIVVKRGDQSMTLKVKSGARTD